MYLLRDDRPLDEYVLQTSEVDAVFEAPVSELLQLFAGKLETIELSGVQHAGSPDAYPVSISAKLEDFVPGDSYWVNLFVMCERFLKRPTAVSDLDLMSDPGSCIASARVASLKKSPRTADVSVSDPGFCTPRIDMHKCSASMTTRLPRVQVFA